MKAADLSPAIRICRVLCIFFMCYVHVNPGLDAFEVPQGLAPIKLVLGDLLGRASVPALSFIAGYLGVAALARRGSWLTYARERWRRLMVPMICWNAIIIAVSWVILQATGASTVVMRELPLMEWRSLPVFLDRLTGFNYGAATEALNFLRDLFVCALLLPALILLLRRIGAPFVSLLWLAGMAVGFAPVVVRSHILMFYSVGVFVALQPSEWDLTVLRKLVLALLVPIVIMALAQLVIQLEHPEVPPTLLRLAVGGGLLAFSYAVRGGSFGRWVGSLAPYVYLMFLAHATIMTLMWGVWQSVWGRGLDWPYPVFYVAAAPLTLLLVVQMHGLLRLMPLPIQHALNGRRAAASGAA